MSPETKDIAAYVVYDTQAHREGRAQTFIQECLQMDRPETVFANREGTWAGQRVQWLEGDIFTTDL